MWTVRLRHPDQHDVDDWLQIDADSPAEAIKLAELAERDRQAESDRVGLEIGAMVAWSVSDASGDEVWFEGDEL